MKTGFTQYPIPMILIAINYIVQNGQLHIMARAKLLELVKYQLIIMALEWPAEGQCWRIMQMLCVHLMEVWAESILI